MFKFVLLKMTFICVCLVIKIIICFFLPSCGLLKHLFLGFHTDLSVCLHLCLNQLCGVVVSIQLSSAALCVALGLGLCMSLIPV